MEKMEQVNQEIGLEKKEKNDEKEGCVYDNNLDIYFSDKFVTDLQIPEDLPKIFFIESRYLRGAAEKGIKYDSDKKIYNGDCTVSITDICDERAFAGGLSEDEKRALPFFGNAEEYRVVGAGEYINYLDKNGKILLKAYDDHPQGRGEIRRDQGVAIKAMPQEIFPNIYLKRSCDLLKIACESGVKDKSYNTTANGFFPVYRGEGVAVVDGQEYKVVGDGEYVNYLDKDGKTLIKVTQPGSYWKSAFSVRYCNHCGKIRGNDGCACVRTDVKGGLGMLSDHYRRNY